MDISTTVEVTADKVEKLEQFADATRHELRRVDVRLTGMETVLSSLATKQLLQETRSELKTHIQEVRNELKTAIQNLRIELKTDLHGFKADIIKWIAGTAIVISAAGITVMTFVLNYATPKPVPAQIQPTAPVIIQMPPWPTMPGPTAAPAKPAGALE